jgi:hypothetical protein
MLDLGGEHRGDGRFGWKNGSTSCLSWFVLPQLLLGNLEWIRAGGFATGIATFHVLHVISSTAKNVTRHEGTPFGMKTEGLGKSDDILDEAGGNETQTFVYISQISPKKEGLAMPQVRLS